MESTVFDLKIFSPVGVAVQEQVKWITIPTIHGEVTLLPAHCKYITVLGVGVISYQTAAGSEVSHLVVRRGACYFADNSFAVIADAVFDPTEGSTDFTEQKKELAEFISKNAQDTPEYRLAEDQLNAISAVEKLTK